ncbi:uncharacterized protein LOC113636360 isoform X3 [Tachysurus fulvidraco]|uniref:uncharacterized protein LOC113636360 isoform X3 n=1 Tax=Tachysurus fulvidraco TaxID=1234273 RepID=UPI000F4DA2D4|nr:uncharacterized protein LOC113636360 isoform X3 [Tachysurus fulvidraco]
MDCFSYKGEENLQKTFATHFYHTLYHVEVKDLSLSELNIGCEHRSMMVVWMMSLRLTPSLSLLFLLLISVVVAQNDRSVKYTQKYICAVRGSTVTMGCSYIYNSINSTDSTFHRAFWFANSFTHADLSTDARYGHRVQYLRDTPHDCSLRIKNVMQNDGRKYFVSFNTSAGVFPNKNGVELKVTALQLKMIPDIVFEGDEVSFTCKTTCSLSMKPKFSWTKSSKFYYTSPSNLLRLPSVNQSHAGIYRCAVEKQTHRSNEVKLTVMKRPQSMDANSEEEEKEEVVLYPNRFSVVLGVVICGLAAILVGLYYTRRKTQKTSSDVASSSQQQIVGEDLYTTPDPNFRSSNDMYNTLGNIYSNPTDDTYTALDLQTRSHDVYNTLATVHQSFPDDTDTAQDSQTISPDYDNLPIERKQQ